MGNADYFMGLETGLKWLKEMRDYQLETNVSNADLILQGVLELIISGYTDMIEDEKAKALQGVK